MIKFLVKGLMRDHHRSLFPILIVTIGVWITVFFQAYLQGVFGDLIDLTSRFSTGHVKVMTRAYTENQDQKPNDLALLGSEKWVEELNTRYPDMTWVQRIQFGGLLDIPGPDGETRSQGPVFGMGVDLFSAEYDEVNRLNIKKAIKKGRIPERSGEILISEKLSEKLDVQIGETATLLGSTMYGSTTFYNFTVVGTIQFGVLAMDRGAMIADIADIQNALDMNDACGEIFGFLPGGIYDNEKSELIAATFNADYNHIKDEFAPTMGTLKSLGSMSDYMDMVEYFSGSIVFVFIFVMSIVLWNAGLLGGLRRYGEVGVRLAIGEQKGHIYRSMIYESVFIGLVGSICGTIVGLGSAYWLQTQGLDISALMKNINMMFPTVFRAKITAETYYIGFIPGFVSTILGTALSGIGIYKRQTAQLFKELEM